MIFHVSAGTPLWLAAAALPALIAHVGAGGLAILSGTTAVLAPKGERLHRIAGTVFFVSMLTMAAMATFMASLIPQRSNVAGGTFTLYLVATAWMTVRRKEGRIGRFEKGAFVFALGAAATYVVFGLQAASTPTGTLDGFPALAYYIPAAGAGLAAALDLKVILRGGISGTPRIARHLWRMCLALFFATGSFFIGQQKVMPKFVHGSPVLFALGLAPLAVMIFWLIRIRLPKRARAGAVAA